MYVELQDGLAMCDLPLETQVVQLMAAVERIQHELIDLRMAQRKALLEELAGLERPLVEQGVIAQRTRPRLGHDNG